MLMRKLFLFTVVFITINQISAAEKKVDLGRSEVGVVQKKVFRKNLRFELTPIIVGTIINDPYVDSYLYGFGLAGHLSDSIALEATYFYSKATHNELNRNLQNDFGKQVVTGKTEKFYSGNIIWSPLYGKLSLLSDYIIHFDTYLTAGFGQTQTDLDTSATINVGIGQRYFLNKLLSMKLEFRNYIHDEVTKDEERGEVSYTKQNLIVTLGLSVFFPVRK